MKKIGIITIGQSPRADVVTEMLPFFGESIDVLERGALDGLSLDKVKSLFPEKDMTPLCTRMSDGTEVVIGKEKILPRIERAVNELDKNNVDIILLLCLGSFPSFEASCLILHPKRIVDRCIESLINKRHRLGIVIPIPEQEDWVRKNFLRITPRIAVTDASPYGEKQRITQAGKVLGDANCDLIVLYCMGHRREFAEEIRTMTKKPVILSSSLVARTIGGLLE